MIYDVKEILAIRLRQLRLKNPIQYVVIILIGNAFVWFINHNYFEGLAVAEFLEYVRDGLTLLFSGLTVSTWKYLPDDHPDKITTELGDVEGNKETL